MSLGNIIPYLKIKSSWRRGSGNKTSLFKRWKRWIKGGMSLRKVASNRRK